jgi:translation initiation factor 1
MAKGEQTAAPFNNPLASLAATTRALPLGQLQPDEQVETAPAIPARAVVRFERKGHGGKEVTVVEKLELPTDDLEIWLARLKKALGCGGSTRGAALVLQGDQRERAADLLAQWSVPRVSVAR